MAVPVATEPQVGQGSWLPGHSSRRQAQAVNGAKLRQRGWPARPVGAKARCPARPIATVLVQTGKWVKQALGHPLGLMSRWPEAIRHYR